jgi:predicted ATPase
VTECACETTHDPRRIVLTGGPGAGKTAVLELIRRSFCRHVRVLPEAAGVVFGGGFPRGESAALRRAGQRAIFHVQIELERTAEADPLAVVLCDRGTIDGSAYWPGPGELWADVGTTLSEQIARYHAVIHLHTPTRSGGYNLQNPLRVESAEEAARIDERIWTLWSGHPRRFVVEPTEDFPEKALRAVEILRDEVPPCCRAHPVRIEGSG